MPQSFFQMYGHLIFSTKNRCRWLDDSVRARTHAYIASVARNMGCSYVHVGGPDDHVHALLEIGKTTKPVDLAAEIKKENSKFVKTIGSEFRDFYWQNGYGLFSVGPLRVSDVAAYIDGQMEHHRQITFKEEYLTFLKRYNQPYDEQYLWD